MPNSEPNVTQTVAPDTVLDTQELPDLTYDVSDEKLAEVNRAIHLASSENVVDTKILSDLIQRRAELVRNLLSGIPNQEKDSFIRREISINDQLLAFAKQALASTKQEMLQISKGKSAVNSYTGKHARSNSVPLTRKR